MGKRCSHLKSERGGTKGRESERGRGVRRGEKREKREDTQRAKSNILIFRGLPTRLRIPKESPAPNVTRSLEIDPSAFVLGRVAEEVRARDGENFTRFYGSRL